MPIDADGAGQTVRCSMWFISREFFLYLPLDTFLASNQTILFLPKKRVCIYILDGQGCGVLAGPLDREADFASRQKAKGPFVF